MAIDFPVGLEVRQRGDFVHIDYTDVPPDITPDGADLYYFGPELAAVIDATGFTPTHYPHSTPLENIELERVGMYFLVISGHTDADEFNSIEAEQYEASLRIAHRRQAVCTTIGVPMIGVGVGGELGAREEVTAYDPIADTATVRVQLYTSYPTAAPGEVFEVPMYDESPGYDQPRARYRASIPNVTHPKIRQEPTGRVILLCKSGAAWVLYQSRDEGRTVEAMP